MEIHLTIKNMCCGRCIVEVKRIFEGVGLQPLQVNLGEVILEKSTPNGLQGKLIKKLEDHGFALALSADEKLAVDIQTLLVSYLNEYLLAKEKALTISNYLSGKLFKSYKYLSKVFKQVTEITIEKYFIKLKVEKAKELLILNEMEINEIAWLLGYSSSQNFSTHFKRETGKTPGEYKKKPIPERIHLPNLIPENLKQLQSLS